MDFDLLRIEEGSTRLMVEVPSLEAVVPELPARAALVRVVGAETTAFDLFLAGLRDAARGEGDSERFDVALLETFGKLGQLLKLGFEEVEIEGEPPCRLDAAAFDRMATLRLRTPLPRQVRVAGRLATIPHDERAFGLHLPEGVVHGFVSASVEPEQLARLAGAQVVVSGLAVFRASGRVLRIEAHHVEAADERASVWRHMPGPLFEAAEPAARYRVRQGPQSGLAAIMGKWPGDETDDARVLSAYAELDAFTRAKGNKMGKDDLWIGAVARAQGAWLLTLDADFLSACPELIDVEHVDPRSLPNGG